MSNILRYLEDSVNKYSEKIAVIDEVESCTFFELKNKSQIIGANLLKSIKDDYEEDKCIVVFMDKSVKTLQAFMGIVYAGCFYCLVDPSFPEDRIRSILSITETRCIITDKKNVGKISEIGFDGYICDVEELLCADKCVEEVVELLHSDTGIEMPYTYKAKLDKPLYCNFTSGSTGVPKGVLISHGSVMNFIDDFVDTFGIDDKDVIGNQAPFDFDVSVKDIYSCLKCGATLVIIPKSYFMFPNKVVDMLEEYKVTTLIWAVSALVMLSRLKALKYKVPSHINKIMFSGEIMPIKQLNIWRECYKDAMFVNLYGPTEITCNCMYYILDRDYDIEEKLPLGRAFKHNEVFLLDKNDKIISDKSIRNKGEICVASTSLAIGYFNNKKATDKSFVMFNKDGEDIRIYKTGDMAYYDEKGNMFFAGRKDFQIKHMGHRIELEEIEKVLSNVSQVEGACCFFDEEKNKVVAYVVGIDDKSYIVNHMRKKVPDYMVPNVFKNVDRMPINKNGKTDRALLKTLYKEGVR